MTNQLTESMRSARLVKTYNLEDYEQQRGRMPPFDERYGLLMKAVRSKAANDPLVTSVGAIAIAIVVGIAAYRITLGKLEVSGLISFITAMLLLSQPARSISTLNAVLQEGFASLQRIFGMMQREETITEKPDARDLIINDGATEATIKFENVTFTYGRDQPAIRNFSLEIPAGKTIASGR